MVCERKRSNIINLCIRTVDLSLRSSCLSPIIPAVLTQAPSDTQEIKRDDPVSQQGCLICDFSRLDRIIRQIISDFKRDFKMAHKLVFAFGCCRKKCDRHRHGWAVLDSVKNERGLAVRYQVTGHVCAPSAVRRNCVKPALEL